MPQEIAEFPKQKKHEVSIIERGGYYVVYCICQTSPVEIAKTHEMADRLGIIHETNE